MDYNEIRELSREQYLLGRDALKTKIKELSEEQKRAKSVIRITRKTTKSYTEKEYAIRNAGYVAENAPKEWECGERRVTITAYLEVYAKIRNKPNCHEMRNYDSYYYDKRVREAWELFKQTTSAKVTESVA